MIKRLLPVSLAAALSLPAVSFAAEAPFQTFLSMQGYSGTLNTPNAYVADEASIHLQYANQQNRYRGRLPAWQDQYMVNVGFFNFAEIGGRLTYDGKINDLSANAKLTTAPLKQFSPWIPNIAIGMQDISGGANHFQNKYVVISEDIWRLRLSAGYGFGPDWMKGGFFGGEFRPFDWLHVLGEYDARVWNVGGRVITPPLPILPIQLTFTGMTSMEKRPGNFSMGVGFTIPLDGKVHKTWRAEPEKLEKITGYSPAASAPSAPSVIASAATAPSSTATDLQQSQAMLPQDATTLAKQPQTPAKTAGIDSPSPKQATLLARLAKAGFTNLNVGMIGQETLVVEYENTRYTHNELDALGVAAGMALQELPAGVERVWLVIKRKGIRMMLVDAPAAELKNYLASKNPRKDDLLAAGFKVSKDTSAADAAKFIDGDKNSGLLQTTIALWPGLSTWVGTDHGPFDYLLSLKAETFTNLWPGAVVNARWDFPLDWSENLDDHKPYSSARRSEKLERLALYQGIKLYPGLMLNVGGGKLTRDYDGTNNELVWMPGDGSHRVKLMQNWGKHKTTKKNRNSYLASYRYFFSPLDLSLEATGGRFLSNDTGYTVELKRYFGDSSVGIYYKNTNIREEDRGRLPRHWEAVGINFSIPLSFRRDMKPIYKVQLRGTDEWNYAQQTTLAKANKDGANYLSPVPLAQQTNYTTSIYSQYHNRDRLTETYLLQHLDRLQEAWQRYGATAENFW